MNVLLITSAQKGSNTDILNQEFSRQLKERNHSIKVLQSDLANHCVGCRACTNTGMCVKYKDPFQIHCDDLERVIVLSGAVYNFGLNSSLSAAWQRLSFMCRNTTFGLILCSGSKSRYGGVDIIKEQFKRFDEYCGTHTVPIVNKVTKDKRLPLFSSDKRKLKTLINNLERSFEHGKVSSTEESKQ